jgi:uncharacterized repeat protein (TIGR03803 family)
MYCRSSALLSRFRKGVTFAIVLLSAMGAFAATPVTYTENVLYSFGPSSTDARPGQNGLVFDKAGNLYGNAQYGGQNNGGAVFELSPDGQGGWTESVIYSFKANATDGYNPYGTLAIDSKGNLYGTTVAGGSNGTGVVYELSPSQGGTWTETILYNFGVVGSGDGLQPGSGVTLKTASGTVLYGTTQCGGAGPADAWGMCGSGSGTVYELSYTKPTKKKQGGWAETILYSFGAGEAGASDGAVPMGSLLLKKGSLYGVTYIGGTGAYAVSSYGTGGGIVFELQPGSSGWTENVLYNFGQTVTDGEWPQYVTPIMDSKGNIYGTTSGGGDYGASQGGNGTVFELVYSPTDNTYTEQALYSFGAQANDGVYPYWGLTQGKAGTFFGTTTYGGQIADGTLFELTSSKKTGQWTETVLFQGGGLSLSEWYGLGQMIADKNYNLYSTGGGGAYGDNVAFEITHTP